MGNLGRTLTGPHPPAGTLRGMSRPDDLESRVSALESQVRELTERVGHSQRDAAAARVLAGGADRDVTEIRAEIRDFRGATAASFNAMREDLTDLRGRTEDGFAEIRGRLDGAAAGQAQIVALLNSLIDQRDDDAGVAG